VRFIAKDDAGNIIAAGTVPQNRPDFEFLVHSNVGFEIINVGEWDMVVGWPAGTQLLGPSSDTELDQVVADLPWGDGFALGEGVDAITGGLAGYAVVPFVPKKRGSMRVIERYRFVQNGSDLNREIEASASGKYNIEGVNVSASTSYLGKIQYSELSTTLIAEYEVVSTEYDEAESYSLSDAAKALLDDPAKFRKAYGDYFIAGGKRGSRFLAVYRCHATNAKSMDEFKASFGGDVPDVFSAEGSARFQQSASQHGISTSFDLYMEGITGTPPNGPWTPEKVLEALAWFKANEVGDYQRAKLRHYSTIDPKFPRTIDVPPEVFVELRMLYCKVWDVRARYESLPAYYREQYMSQFRELDFGVGASQNVLASDAAKRLQYQRSADVLLKSLEDVLARMDFYLKVRNAIGNEPGEGAPIEEGKGQQSWMYGFSVYGKSDAVVIQESRITYSETWHIGWREKTLELGPDDSKLIVGWMVVSNWGDGSNGSWWKATDQILLKSHGAVHVKSQYDRGCNWTVVYYYVDAKDYQFAASVRELGHKRLPARDAVSGDAAMAAVVAGHGTLEGGLIN
jgi:hypothetical protein